MSLHASRKNKNKVTGHMSKMKTHKTTAACIFILTTVCLIITSLMTRQSGVSQGSTLEGQQYLGMAAIAIHLGLPVFGIASGAFWRSGIKALGIGAFVLVLLCATFSLRNIMNFVAAERISIAKKHDAEAKTKRDREQAAIKAAADRQHTINKMAQDQLAWVRGTVKDAGDRRERKDSMDAGTKFITDFSKTEIAVAPTVDTTKDTTVQSEAGAELLAEITGWKLSAIQLGDVIQIAAMLLVFEIFGWPLASYLWGLNVPVVAAAGVGALAVETTPLTPVAATKTKLLSGPKDNVITIRTEPTAEWRKLLNKIDFPPPGARHKGGERPRLEPEVQALRFLTWLGSYDERGRRHNTEVEALYFEFLNADHRKETAVRQVKSALESVNRGKFASKKAVPGEGTVWNIDPPPLERMKLLLQKARIIETEASDAESVESPQRRSASRSEPEDTPALEAAGSGDSKVLAFFGRARSGLH